jgi:hypothetical protein
MSHYDLLTSLVLPLLAGVPLVLRRVLAGRSSNGNASRAGAGHQHRLSVVQGPGRPGTVGGNQGAS